MKTAEIVTTPDPTPAAPAAESARDPFEGYSSIAIGIAQNSKGEKVICWANSYDLASDMLVTLVGARPNNYYRVMECVKYAGTDIGRLLGAYTTIFQVKEMWYK